MQSFLDNVKSDNIDNNIYKIISSTSDDEISIPSEKIKDFWINYCDTVNNKKSDICEIVENKCPVVIEFLLYFKKMDAVYFDEKFLQYMTRAIQYTIMDTCMINNNHIELLGCVLYTEPWKADRYNQKIVRFRFQFPYCVLDINFMDSIFKTKLIYYLNRMNVLNYLLVKPTENKWDKLLYNFIPKDLPLYGSNKNLSKPLLELKYIWCNANLDYIDNDNHEFKNVESCNIDYAFNPMNHYHANINLIGLETFAPNLPNDSEDEYEVFIDKKLWLPMFLSIHYIYEISEINPSCMLDEHDENETVVSPYGFKKIFGLSEPKEDNEITELDLAEKLLTMINYQRFFDKLFWLDIVKALNNASNSTEEGLTKLIHHTKNALRLIRDLPDFYNEHGSLEETCRVYYFTNSNSLITYKTLGFYAKNDNPTKYGEWHREWCRNSMERSLTCLDADVGEAIYRYFWLDFVCTDYKKGIWYEFKYNRWIENSGCVSLINKCQSEFIKLYLKEKITIDQLDYNTNDQAFSNSLKFASKKIDKLITCIKTYPKLNCYIKNAGVKFHNDKFHQSLDTNPMLTGVLNGVIEIDNNDVVFRCGKPEDYISKCTSVQYESYYSWNHNLVIECFDWLSKVFPDKSLLHQFLKFASSGLIGLNSGKTFAIWSGKLGNNSKSMVQKLFESTYGPYCINLPVEILTGKDNGAGNASPHLARARATRFAFISETDDDKPMNKAVIKRYTGGDKFYARFLHDNGCEIIATFKLIMVCNEISGIPNADKAVMIRTKIFPFLAEWVEYASESIDEQYLQLKFQMDTNFESKIPKLSSAFLWICCEYYKYYAFEGLLPEPEIVIKTTEKYWQEKDHYAHFISECIRKSDDENAKIKISDLYKRFKTWYMDSYPMCINSMPNITSFKTALKFRWGEPIGQYWRGIVIIEETENDPLSIKTDENEDNQNDNNNIDIVQIGSMSKQNAEEFLNNIKIIKSNMRNIVKDGLEVISNRRFENKKTTPVKRKSN